jgi:hypothetical protein
MNVGDKIPVSIAGQTVVMADVKELADGTATLIIPATRVVMATRTELTMEGPSNGGGVELLTDEVVRPEAPVVATEAPAQAQTIEAPAPSPVANADAAVQSVEQATPVAVEAPSAVETPSE